MFNLLKEVVEISRSVYVSNKSTWTTIIWTTKWYLKPLKPDDSLFQWAFWKDFSLTIWIKVDMKEWDQLVIKWEKYKVRWLVDYDGISVKYKRALLVKT